MKRNFKAKIFYTTDENHPDTRREIRDSFEDVYKIDDSCFWGEDNIMAYIKNDLKLIAGGGCNWEHIHDIKFEITEI